LKRKIGNSPVIFLINKSDFRKAVNTHIKLFKNLLGEDIDCEIILNQIEQEDSDIREILHRHDCLIGILLGFGKHNSILYEKRENLEKKLNQLNLVQSYQEIQSIKNQLDKLWGVLEFRNDYYTSNVVSGSSIAFVADRKHPESKILEAKYKKQTVRICEVYSKDDWFEKTLQKIISE
jgi:hypothetical protein